ncbi:MAG: anti-sigma F factor [bacterium]|jgi:stage II sporulation protein AB (anti-sigma F factor)
MDIINQMKLEFPAQSNNISFARATVAAFVGQLDPTLADLDDINTAVSEAVTNAIVHGYNGDPAGIVSICVRLFSDHNVEIIVTDQGKGISDVEHAKQFGKTSQPEERIGIGFNLMEQCMDEVIVSTASHSPARQVSSSFIQLLGYRLGLIKKPNLSIDKQKLGTKVIMRKKIPKLTD